MKLEKFNGTRVSRIEVLIDKEAKMLCGLIAKRCPETVAQRTSICNEVSSKQK